MTVGRGRRSDLRFGRIAPSQARSLHAGPQVKCPCSRCLVHVRPGTGHAVRFSDDLAPNLAKPRGQVSGTLGAAPGRVTRRPHDALFKAAFGAPADAAGLFRSVLPTHVIAAIEWSSLVRLPGSFVDPDLADRHSDLLFSVELHDGDEVLLYLLVEHQSGVDPDMPLRVLGYEVRIWERCKTRPRSLILPIVLAHAAGGWTEPTSFGAQFVPRPEELGIAELVPQFEVTIIDLADRTDDEILRWSLGTFQKLALWLMRDARDNAVFQAALPRWKQLLSDAHDAARRAPHAMQAFSQLIHYVWHVIGDLRFTEFRAKLLEQIPDAQDTVMTIAEELFEQGRAQGIEQGRAQVLRHLLGLKFGALDPATDARITEATAEQVERYLERFVNASTLAEVFSD